MPKIENYIFSSQLHILCNNELLNLWARNDLFNNIMEKFTPLSFQIQITSIMFNKNKKEEALNLFICNVKLCQLK